MMKNSVFGWLILTIFFLSCNQIERHDLTGHWELLPAINVDENAVIPRVINFDVENVELIDDYLFQQSGTYELKDKRLKMSLEGGQKLEFEIMRLDQDTLEFTNGSVFFRNWDISAFDFEEYQLIGIPTGENLKTPGLFAGIHFYKNAENELKIRTGDAIIEYQDLPRFLVRSPGLAVFIGKGIKLQDLKELYFPLAAVDERNVTLVLNEVEYGKYEVFKDWIEIWWDDLEEHFESKKMIPPPLPPPPLDAASREQYLTQVVEVIEINEPEDLGKMTGLEVGKKYLVSISENLPVEDYIKVKKHVFEMREAQNLDVKTEIL